MPTDSTHVYIPRSDVDLMSVCPDSHAPARSDIIAQEHLLCKGNTQVKLVKSAAIYRLQKQRIGRGSMTIIPFQ